jgi:hypothetical protein
MCRDAVRGERAAARNLIEPVPIEPPRRRPQTVLNQDVPRDAVRGERATAAKLD